MKDRQKQSHSEERLRRNAAFLIETSEKIDYDQGCLSQMREAFRAKEFSDVIDLAYMHDRAKRAHKRCCQKEPAASRYANEVISELSPESSKEAPLQWCVAAIRLLSRDLTYENRELAKHEIRKAIHTLSET